MRKIYSKIVLITFLLLHFFSVFADETNCNDTRIDILSVEASDCAATGQIVARLSGPDTAYISMERVQFRVVSQTPGVVVDPQFSFNGGIFKNLPPASYIVQTRAFCHQLDDSIQVSKSSAVVTVTGDYMEPNMFVSTANIRKTFNCKVSGMIPIGFYGGKAPYTARMISHPAAYDGDTLFVRTGEGRFEIDNIPAGEYVFTLSDACGYTIPNLSATVETLSSDFPSNSMFVQHSIYAATPNCKAMTLYTINFGTLSEASSELFPYFLNLNNYYDLVLTEDDGTEYTLAQSVSNPSPSGSEPNRTISYHSGVVLLNNLTYGDLYPSVAGWPGGQHKAYVSYRLKGTDCYSSVKASVADGLRVPYAINIRVDGYDCDGANVYAGQWSDYDGVICYPITAEAIDHATGEVMATNDNITSSSQTLIGKVPYGHNVYLKFTSNAGGGSWTVGRPGSHAGHSQYNIDLSYKGEYYSYSPCGEVNGRRGMIRLSLMHSPTNSSNFVPGTVIKPIEYPTGQIINNESVTISNSTTYRVYPYSKQPFSDSNWNFADILPGTHKFEVSDPCGNVDTITIVYPDRKPTYYFDNYQLTYCPEDGNRGYIRFYIYDNHHGTSYRNLYFAAGTVIKVVSAPAGQSIPHDSIVIAENTKINYIYPYAPNPASAAYSNILPGVHKFEIKTPCGDIDTISTTWTETTPRYTNYTSDNYNYYLYDRKGHCKENIGKFFSYTQSDAPYIAGQSVIKLKSGPTGFDSLTVIHRNVTIPGGTTNTFNPFNPDYTAKQEFEDLGNIMPGNYVFTVYDAACGSSYDITITVPTVFTVEQPLSYTIEYDCKAGYGKVTPYGIVKKGTANQTVYYRISAAWNANGTTMSTSEYDTNQITSGQSFYLTKNGRYLVNMHVHGQNSNSYCFTDTISVSYVQPAPRLDMTKTSAYVCADDNIGYLKLKATGGYGNGPYEYRIYGTDSVNYTGEFRYGGPGEELEIIITDMSPEADGCNPYFIQKVVMVDLKDSGIAYTIADRGIFCEGSTIDLNMISLGETRYDWTGPNGFVADSVQYPRIPDAALNMSGWYKVTVEAEHCGAPFVDSVYIDVRQNPSDVTIDTDTLELCRRSTAYYIELLNPQVSSDCTLKWYDYNGDEMTVTSTTAINTNNIGTRTYWVSQVNNDSKCEGPKTPFVITIRVPPTNPLVLNPDAVCWGDSVYLKIVNTETTYTYYMYTSSTGNAIAEKPGNGDTLTFSRPPITSATTYYFSLVDDLGCASGRSQRTVNMAASAGSADITFTDDTICTGEQATLLANSFTLSDPTYRWYDGTSINSTLLHTGDTYQTPVLTYTGDGVASYSYYLSVQAEGLCETPPGSRVRVRAYVKGPFPYYYLSATPAVSNDVCRGDSVLIRPYVTYNNANYRDSVFYWYTSQTEDTPFYIGDSLWVTPPADSYVEYYIGATSALRCLSTQNNRLKVTITDRYFQLAYNNDIDSVCAGERIQLNASRNGSLGYNSAGTWTSSDEGIATISSSGYITTLAPGRVAFTYRYSSKPYCEVVSDTLTVKALPTFSFENDRDSICVGDTIRLTASEAGTWYANNSRAQVLNNLADVVGVSAGTVTFNFTGSVSGCSNTTQTLTIIGYPAVSPITGDNFVCVGNIIRLSNSTTGGVWGSDNNSIATVNNPLATQATILAVDAGETNITYTVSSVGSLCKTTVRHPLTVLPLTAPNITIGIEK